MEMILKLVIISATSLVICGFMKECLPHISTAVTMAAIMLVVFVAFPLITDITQYIWQLLGGTELKELIDPVLKILIITTVSKIMSDMCADSGEKALGNVVEIFGTLCAMGVVFPLLVAAVKGIGSII